MTKYILFLIVVVFVNSNTSLCQSSEPKVYKDWFFVVEKGLKDVHYRVIECQNIKQVQLRVFNDSPADQKANFFAEIINLDNGEKFSKEIKMQLKGMGRYQPDCESALLSDLKMEIPKNFNALNIEVKILFKD